MPGVSRRMLDRKGEEVARATSIVRYAPHSHFSPHVHTGGEEFIVLEGVFQDEYGDYPAGTYIRNPPASKHTPRSELGCILFVKLWQFDPSDRSAVQLDMLDAPTAVNLRRPGVEAALLYQDDREAVSVETWKAGIETEFDADGGAELLVLDGEFEDTGEQFGRYSWLRIPEVGRVRARVGRAGARVWVKTGHLRFATEYVPVR